MSLLKPETYTDRLAVWTAKSVIAVGVGAIIFTLGCQTTGLSRSDKNNADLPGSPSAAVNTPSAPAFDTADHAGDRPESFHRPAVVILQINFEILRARVAKGVFSRSRKIWNHLDGEAIAADTAVLLQRNGLRVARGKLDSWPPIKALLEAEKQVEISQNSMTVSNGLPLLVELDPRPKDQTLFMFRRDGPLAGRPFPESTNFFRIEYEIPLNDPQAVEVVVMPEVRQPRILSPLRLGQSEQNPQSIQRPARVFRELAFQMKIEQDEFFVIGPSPSVDLEHIIGALLLCEKIDGLPYESMYFITPQVIRRDRPGTP